MKKRGRGWREPAGKVPILIWKDMPYWKEWTLLLQSWTSGKRNMWVLSWRKFLPNQDPSMILSFRKGTSLVFQTNCKPYGCEGKCSIPRQRDMTSAVGLKTTSLGQEVLPRKPAKGDPM